MILGRRGFLGAALAFITAPITTINKTAAKAPESVKNVGRQMPIVKKWVKYLDKLDELEFLLL
jgi:hypothetical protein